MSFGSLVGDIGGDVSHVVGGIKSALGYGPGKQQPGVGGPAKDPSLLRLDPTTGYYVDPTTGTTYTDASGAKPVMNPNVAQQVATNTATGRDFLGQLPADRQGFNAATAGLGGQVAQLNNTITNPGASSVAATQLAMGNDANARQALGSAAGIGGPNAFAARRAAIQAIASGNIGTEQSAALLRAQEVQNAQQMKGQALGALGTLSNVRQGQDIGASGDYAQLGLTGQTAQQGLNASTDAQDKKDKQNFGQRALGTLTQFL